MHIFYVQGGGLGHLTRIDKLIKTLNIPKGDVKIITPSNFTSYFKDYNFIKLSWADTPTKWCKQIENTIRINTISKFYIDTFPYGLKGELNSIYKTFPDLNYVYVSRVLKWEKYLDDITLQQPVIFSNTIILERLYKTHSDWITSHSKNVLKLRLKPDFINAHPFIDAPYTLVVHSGGKAGVLKICNQAIEDYKTISNIKIIVFTQVNVQLKEKKILIYNNMFPVSQYYKHAIKIYTAAGFNSIQELKHYRHKHIIIPLDKLYDDQFFRTSTIKN